MSTSASEISTPVATNVKVTTNTLTVALSDGRTISVPTAWYPRLSHGTARENGMLNEIIRVYNEATRKNISCTVLDSKTVLVCREGG